MNYSTSYYCIFSNFYVVSKKNLCKLFKFTICFLQNLFTTILTPYPPIILTSKISKPAISSTPMKCCLFCLVSRVSLHFLTSHLKRRSNMPLQRAPTELATWSLLRPWVTNSFPTLMRGLSKFLYKSWQSTPRSLATRSPSCNRKL